MPYIGNPIYQSAFVVDQFSGNGSTTAFTMSVAPAGVTNVLVAVSGVLQDPSTYGVVGNTITFSAAPPSGTGNISCRYLGVPVTGVTTTAYRTVTEFTATASQTTFTPPSYTVGFINVYLNGVLLGSADYTATNGTTVVLATGASAGNLVTVESFLVSSVLNAIPATTGSVGSTYIANSVSLVTPKSTTTIGVGNATPAASGAGITFPATQSASSDANTLDDYEEGTFTPTAYGSASGGPFTFGTQTGYYTKIGREVKVSMFMSHNSTVTFTGAYVVGNLPFVTSGYSGGGFVSYFANWTSNSPKIFQIEASATFGYLRMFSTSDQASMFDLNSGLISNNTSYMLTILYQTN